MLNKINLILISIMPKFLKINFWQIVLFSQTIDYICGKVHLYLLRIDSIKIGKLFFLIVEINLFKLIT